MIRTILVDDEISALNNLKRLLKSYEQVEILEAYTDISRAIEKIKNEKVDLVFLDIEMPKMNGIEAAERIKEIDSNINIVFITAYSDYALEAFEVEAIDYVMKPIIKRRLDKTINKLLKGYSNLPKNTNLDEEVRILCFGNFELAKGKKKVKWRTSKTEELSAYLLDQKGSFIHKSKIIEDLWPDKDEEQANKILHTTVYYARSALRSLNLDEEIIYSNKMYKFDLNLKFFDIVEFDRIFSSCREITKENIDMVENCIRLYNGEYFEDKDYNWAIGKRVYYRERYIDMVVKLSNYYIKDKNYIMAIPYLKVLLEKEPYIEKIHRRLLDAYMNVGDYTKFKQHYRRVEENFREELGIELGDKTKELYKKMISKIKK